MQLSGCKQLKRKMKLNLIFSLLVLSSTWTFGQTPIDFIAVQIGDNPILYSDIQTQKFQAMQSGMKDNPELECIVLNELMYQNLLLNQAKLDSIEISNEQVDAEMESRIRVIENQIGGREKMEQFYGKSIIQIKAEFRSTIHDQLLAKEMEFNVTNEISVTPKETENFYKKIPVDSLPLINSQLKFQQIVIYPEVTSEDKAVAFKELEEIRKKIVNDKKSFSTQARIHSDDPGSASKGGEIEATKGMMVPPFEAAVFSLKKGEVSEIIESTYGYHIIKLIERKGDDYICQHILKTPKFNDQSIEAAALKLDSCYRKLKNNEISWENAVLQYSNDEFTRLNNGTITNPINGKQTWDMDALNQVDRQIYLLTDKMEPGDVSEPNFYENIVAGKQGVRIVRLVERSAPHRANLKQDYDLISNAALNEKKQKVIADWVKSKISGTYVKINAPYDQCNFSYNWMKK